MSLLERLQQETKAAMLARATDKLGTLRLLKSAIGYAQMERQQETLSDAEVIALVHKEIKKRRDSAEQFTAGGRPELASKERSEIEVLESFLPAPLAAEDLEQLVRETIQQLGAVDKKQMGAVIKAVQAKAAGRADGKSISGLVSKLLP